MMFAATILRGQKRPGFSEPFHEVLFPIEEEGVDGLVVPIWFHPAYPDDRIETVARTFLDRGLAALADAAAAGSTMTPAECYALWQSVTPPTVEGHPTSCASPVTSTPN